MAKIHSFFSNTDDAVDMRCSDCAFGKRCKSPRMSEVGKGGKEILIVIDAVDSQADRSGSLADSQSYKFLNTELRKKGINIYKDCWVTSAIQCDTGGAKPSKKEADKCNYRLMEQIKELKPKYIWTFGNIALGSITDKYYKGILDTAAHGDVIPITEFSAFLTPFYAIFMVQAKKKDPNFQSVFLRDLQKAVIFAKKENKFINYNYTSSKNITFLLKAADVVEQIECLINLGEAQTFDIETTGLKPHVDGHKVTTMAISTDDHCWSFPIDYQSYWNEDDWNDIRDSLKDYLNCSKVYHVAHNKNFENLWSHVLLENKKNVDHCTQATQHILDHRRGTKRLKYQIFKRWGLHSYEKNADRYIISEGKSSNAFNKMDEMPLPEQLLYVGIDAFCTMKLYREQQKELKGKLKDVDKFWQKSVNTMSTLQLTGIHIDTKYYEETEKELTDRIIGLEKSIRNNEDVKKFAKRHRRSFAETSPEDVKDLLFNQMGLESTKETDGGNQAVDAEVLKDLDIPITNYILDLRKYLKLRDTYLGQYKREEVDGLLHPSFGLSIPVSYRSQSDSPNMQNTPKRDKEAKILIRKGIIPRPGNLLAEVDFSGMEVSTSATYHKDPNFIKYLITPGTDMHRDNGSDIWQLPGEEITQEIRFFIKNGWTFPQFYGDYFGSCAPNLWETSIELKIKSGITLREHLRELGITQVEEFTEHCKTAEDIMWNKRFKVYTQWKKDINDFYIKNGYVETHMGFRFTDYMDKKQTANYPIQGCLQGHCKVLTSIGWKRIDSLVEKTVNVWTGFAWKPAIGINRGECQIAQVQLDSGLYLDCDIRHEFKNEKNEWVKFQDLKIGDYVALPLPMNQLKYSYKMNWEFLLGFIVGDGWFGMKKITKTRNRYNLNIYGGKIKLPILEDIKKFLTAYHCKGFSIPKLNKTKTNMWTLSIEGKELAKKLQSFGHAPNKTAHTKSIPNFIWKGTQQQQRDFMEGLWLSDGDRKNKSLHMCNQSLLEEVQILLFGLGYDSAIRQTKDGWKLSPRNILHDTYSSRSYPKTTLEMLFGNRSIPYNKSDNTTITDRRALASNKDCSQKIAERILSRLPGEPEIYRYDKVTNILVHKGEVEETYTMSVQDNLHQFVADGIICKNTAFHLLLFCLNTLIERKKEYGWNSHIIGQVHDSGMLDLIPEEKDDVLSEFKHIAEVELAQAFDWINVPYHIDCECSSIDGNFAEMKDYEIQ